MKDSLVSIFSLFTSSSTLFCCALPAIFVMLGSGASFASFISVFPFLITLSVYKIELTLFAFLMMGIAGYSNYRASFAPCPVDPEQGRKCMVLRKRSRLIFYISSGILIFATFFTYVVPEFI